MSPRAPQRLRQLLGWYVSVRSALLAETAHGAMPAAWVREVAPTLVAIAVMRAT